MTHSLEYITLEDLYIHDLNPRTHHDPTEVAAKAASILEIGLAQNLAGYADPAQPGKAGIVGGGYRLLALRSIQEQGHTEGHLQSLLENVPVQVTDDPRQAEA